MGTTSEKLTYLNTTKGKIKDSINLTGANITNEPFRQYSTKLQDAYVDIINNGTDTLYNNFPKVSGEGTSLTLNNTYQAPMRNNLKGNTSQTGTPTPTSPIPVNVVSGDNKITINSKNQLETYNISGTYNGVSYTLQDGVLTLNGTCTASGAFTGLGIFRQSKGINYKWTYVYESGSCTDYGGGLFMGATPTSTTSAGYGAGFRVSQSRTVGTFNNGEEHIYYLYITLNTNSTYTNYKVKPLIVQGNDYSYDFEPYQGNTYNIDLPSGMELCKIGNYQDYFYKDSDKWYLHKEIGKVVLDGSESWANDGGTVGTNYRHNITVANLQISTPLGTTGNSISNYFKTSTVGFNNQKWGNFYLSSTWLVMTDQDAVYSSVADFKTWLSTHNTNIYYVLATPTNTEITDTTLINQLKEIYNAKSKNGQTNISQINNDLGFIISASALKKG